MAIWYDKAQVCYARSLVSEFESPLIKSKVSLFKSKRLVFYKVIGLYPFLRKFT